MPKSIDRIDILIIIYKILIPCVVWGIYVNYIDTALMRFLQ